MKDSNDANSINFTKHHWIVNHPSDADPIEMEFEHPTSLISLNIELLFNCKDIKALVEKLNKHEALNQAKKNQEI